MAEHRPCAYVQVTKFENLQQQETDVLRNCTAWHSCLLKMKCGTAAWTIGKPVRAAVGRHSLSLQQQTIRAQCKMNVRESTEIDITNLRTQTWDISAASMHGHAKLRVDSMALHNPSFLFVAVACFCPLMHTLEWLSQTRCKNQWPSSCTACALHAYCARRGWDTHPRIPVTCLVARRSSKAHMRTTKLPSTCPL